MIWKYFCGFLGGVLGLLVGSLFCYTLEQVFGSDLFFLKSDGRGLVAVLFVPVFAGLGMMIAERLSTSSGSAGDQTGRESTSSDEVSVQE